MRTPAAALALALALSLPACTTMSPEPATPPPTPDAALAALVHDTRRPLASVAALAVQGGRVVYQGHFGRRHIDADDPRRDRAVDAHTLYRVASISKLVVALAVMRLVQEGRLDLDADVSTRLGWPLRNPRHPTQPITLRLLMSHRSSLTDGPGRYAWAPSVALRDVLVPGGSLHHDGEYWDAEHAPGTWFRYANLNWGVVATVMERATGERFDRLMQRLVLQPLGLRGGFNPAALAPSDVADIAVQYRKRREAEGREIWEPDGPWVVQADDYARQPPQPPPGLDDYEVGSNGTVFSPQGGLRTTLAGLGTLVQMLLDDGRHQGRVFLDPASVRALAAEHWRYDEAHPNGDSEGGGVRAWGLGPQIFVDHGAPGRGDRLVEGGGFSGWGHLGDAYGLLGVLALDPARRLGLVVLATGPGVDPATYPGQWSSMPRWLEIALTALDRHARLARGPGPGG